MKKFTLLILSLLLFLGGVKAQNLSKGKSVFPIGNWVEGVTQEGLNKLTDGNRTGAECNFGYWKAADDVAGTLEISEVQSWYIDLGAEQEIGEIKIYWEGASATKYNVYGGNDITNIEEDTWGTAIVTEENCEGGDGKFPIKSYKFSGETVSKYRYLKFKAIELFAKDWGCKMYEFEVRGTEPSKLVEFDIDHIHFGNNFTITPILKDQYDEQLSGIPVYECNAAGFSAINNVLTFKDTPEGKYTVTATYGGVTKTNDICIVTKIPAQPTIDKNDVFTVFCDAYSTVEPGISDPGWEGGHGFREKINLTGDDNNPNYVYSVRDVSGFGLDPSGITEDTKANYLVFDIYVAKTTTGKIVLQNTTDEKSDALTFEGGKWNHFELKLKDGFAFKKAPDHYIYFTLDNPCDILLDNVFFTTANLADDGEDPVILRSLIGGKGPVSATLRLQAYDNSGEVTFKVEVKKGDDVIQTIDNIAAKSEEFVRLVIKNLDINTIYTATVTATDRGGRSVTAVVKGIGENEDFFETENIPLAETQQPATTEYYYLHGKSLLRGEFYSGGQVSGDDFKLEEIEIPTEDGIKNAVSHTFKENENYGLWIDQTAEDAFKNDKNSIIRIALYPIEFEEIRVAPRFYYTPNPEFKTIKLTPNEWNYIAIKPGAYTHADTDPFVALVFNAEKGSRIFLDNYCRYTTADNTAPTIANFDIIERHAESVKVSFKLSDEVGENEDKSAPINYEIHAKSGETDNVIGFGTTTNPGDVTYYARGLKGKTNYTLYVVAWDKAQNRASNEIGGSRLSNFEYSNDISLEEKDGKGGVKVLDKDKGGKVIVNPGMWNIKEFNKIAAKYPYGCFDLRDVIFPDKYSGKPEDEGKDYAMNYDANDAEHGLRLFNHNAYIIVDEFNRVNANYAVPTVDGKLQGMNFNWFDGDFTIEDGPNRALASYYKEIIDAYEKATETKYPGLTRFGYIKCDPYIGEDVQFEEQGAAMTRQMFTSKAVNGSTEGTGVYDTEQKDNKFSTIVCPFPLSTENITRCAFYRLTAPTYDVKTNNITLNFTQVYGMTKANTPYLIRVKEGKGGSILFADAPENTKKQLAFNSENYDNTLGKNLIATEETTGSSGDLTVTLYGTYTSQDLKNEGESKKFYGLKQGNGEKLTLGTAKRIDFPAFRAMIAISGPKLAAAKSFNISFDGEVTGITEINNEAISTILDNVYSIDGKKVGNTRNGLINLPAGIYIVNGKKVVIK